MKKSELSLKKVQSKKKESPLGVFMDKIWPISFWDTSRLGYALISSEVSFWALGLRL